MDKESTKKPLLNSAILKAVLIFVLSYLVFLAIWLVIKSYYGLLISTIASYAITIVKNVEIVEIIRNKDIVTVGFIPQKFGVTILKTAIDIPTSNYAFNAPLTLAIMAAFYPFMKRKRIYIEALVILVIVHFLYVFSLEGEKLTRYLTAQGYEKSGTAAQIFWEFLWGFVDNMVVRFEPFLIGAYLYFFRNTEPVKLKAKKSRKTKK